MKQEKGKLTTQRLKRRTSLRGVVFVEFLVASTLLIFCFLFIAFLISHLWAKSFVQIESFYLARAQLYGNSPECLPNEELVSTNWISRDYLCEEENSQVKVYFQLPLQSPYTEGEIKSGLIKIELGGPTL